MPFDPEQLPVPDLGLQCLNCGYSLTGLMDHRCPECGRVFRLEEYIPEGGFPPLIAGGEPVRATEEVLDLLHLHRIPHMELRDVLGELLGISHFSATRGSSRVGVMREHYFQAIDLVRRWRRNEPMPEPPTPPPETDWICPECGEANPGHFQICWNCEHEPENVPPTP